MSKVKGLKPIRNPGDMLRMAYELDDGRVITHPRKTYDGKYGADPTEAYGITAQQADWLDTFNAAVRHATRGALATGLGMVLESTREIAGMGREAFERELDQAVTTFGADVSEVMGALLLQRFENQKSAEQGANQEKAAEATAGAEKPQEMAA